VLTGEHESGLLQHSSGSEVLRRNPRVQRALVDVRDETLTAIEAMPLPQYGLPIQ
jgi:hypothetical protein